MSDSEKIDARLSRVYDNPGDKQALFDDWAPTYDHDLVNEMGYVADAEACRQLETLVPDRQARILDAGCGTGLVGRRLRQAGYKDIHGRKLEKETPVGSLDTGEDDALLTQAVAIIRETHRASTSSLQRRLRIGYTRAARIMDILEERGVIGPPRGSDPREILIDLDGDIPDNAVESVECEEPDGEEEPEEPEE